MRAAHWALHLKRDEPGYFNTRQIDLDGPTGRKLYPAMRVAMDANNLVQTWLDQLAAEQSARQQAYNESLAAQRIKDVTPDLLAALEQIKRLGTEATQDLAEAGRIRGAIVEIASKALAAVAPPAPAQ
jgi:hypothetical protein